MSIYPSVVEVKEFLLDYKERNNISWRILGELTGVPETTLHKFMTTQKKTNADRYISLCQWIHHINNDVIIFNPKQNWRNVSLSESQYLKIGRIADAQGKKGPHRTKTLIQQWINDRLELEMKRGDYA